MHNVDHVKRFTNKQDIPANKVVSFIGFMLLYLSVSSTGLTGESESHGRSSSENYRFGVFPLQSPTKLAKLFMPFVDQLEQVLDKPVQFLTAPDIHTFNERVARHEYDIIYLSSLTHSAPYYSDYKIIAELAIESFVGILVVRKDDGLEKMRPGELPRDIMLGLPNFESYTTSMMQQQNLEQLGVGTDVSFETRYFRSHDAALLALYYGLVDVVGTWQISLNSMPMNVRNALYLIGESRVQPKMIIAVRPDYPDSEILMLNKLLTGLSKSEQGYRSLINPVITIESLGMSKSNSSELDYEYSEDHE